MTSKVTTLLERMVPDYQSIRAVLVDFNKACFIEDAQVYKLSANERLRYAKCHPQVAPEVRDGLQKQSYASDIYAFGRVIDKVNTLILKHSEIV